MSEPNLQLLGGGDFIPDKYVREISQNCVGRSELVRLKNIIHQLSDETSSNLKKNVYQNYMQFIDTAKEISHLESEMYQLSHLLAEQKILLGALYNTSILGDDTPKVVEKDLSKQSNEEREDDMQQKIAAVFEKVEGCKDLSEMAHKALLHEGYFTELDAVENSPIKTVCGFLFTEGIMLTTSIPNARGPMRYKLESYYEIGTLAVVNVRDLGNIKYAFKLLAFPDTRVFQCKSNMSKKEWLDKFDQAKKARLTQDTIKRESISDKSPSRSASIDSPSLNPFEETEDDICEHPDWLLEAPEELDVYVAQRHFDEALTLLHKTKDYIVQHHPQNMHQPDHNLQDLQRKVEQRHTMLTEVLMKELEVNPDKSLQGGLRAARKAVRLLNQLGRSRQSCELFLKLCSSMLKTQYKRVKREGSTNMYVRHLSSVVFTNLCHMTEEFLRAFPNSASCTSAFIVWASTELSLFTTHFIKQVFVPQTSLTTLAECVVLVRLQCDRLCHYGIDLCYQIDGSLRTPVTKALKEARDKQVDVIKRKFSEAVWTPTNLRTKSGIQRCLQEHSEIGLVLDGYVTGDCWIQLSGNTMGFIKLYLQLLDDCLKLKTPELMFTVDEILYDVFEAQINFIEQAVRTEMQSEQKQFIVKNANFLLGTLLDLVQKKYKDTNGFNCKTLEKLAKEHTALMKGVTPQSRKVTSYVSNEYL